MTPWEILGLLFAAALGTAVALFKPGGKYNPHMPSTDHSILDVKIDSNVTATNDPAPLSESTGTPHTEAPVALWDTPKHAYHSVRVICDEMGLTVEQKNILCACIYQESQFMNGAVGKNKTSTDWGLVQVNDTPGWHIGPGLRFSSVQDVLDHPEKAVRWMVSVMKNTGKLQPWASYTSGAYKKWLVPTSPLWALKS